jgi:hypothetical protein
MKTKIVLWGTDADGRVLIALELRPDANKVDIFTFPSAIVTDDFTTQMMDKWRNGEEVPFVEGYKHIECELAVADSILPIDLKAERPDIISRAQTEWHFIVLSSKLNQAYRSELDDYKDKVEKMTAYDGSVWDTLKGFWDKVQEQVRDRTLSREHADLLRDGINDLFTKLKDMRTALSNEFEQKSAEVHGRFASTLNNIEERIKSNPKASSIFDDLKGLQAEFRTVKMTREHNNEIWARIDACFKAAKTGKFGEQATNVAQQEFTTASARIQNRLDGLNTAIGKMEITLRREKEELDFQKKKIATTDGQLEAQLRQAKMRIIQDRASSIEEKLKNMYDTRTEVEKSLVVAQEKDAKRTVKEDKIVVDVVAPVATNVQTDIVTTSAEATTAQSTEELVASVEAEPTSFVETAQIALQDTVDTVMAAAEVVGDKIEDFIEDLTKTEDTKEA